MNTQRKTVLEERKKIVDSIVKDLESGKVPFWEKTWVDSRPQNLLKEQRNGKDKGYYRGVNAVRLSIVAQMKGYKDNRWCSYKQCAMLGGNVKHGEKATYVEYWKFEDYKKAKNPKTGKWEVVSELNPETGKIEPIVERRYNPPILNYTPVFNAEQMEGIPAAKIKNVDLDYKNKAMETLLDNVDVVINYSKEGNFYAPKLDMINLIPKEDFKSTDDFYHAACHEIAHSTGHPSRLNRIDISGKAPTPEEYAREELRAELAGCFIRQEYGIPINEDHIKNHSAYIGGWAKNLKENPNEIYKAADQADKIVKFIKSHYIDNHMELSQEKENADTKEKTTNPPPTTTEAKTEKVVEKETPVIKDKDDVKSTRKAEKKTTRTKRKSKKTKLAIASKPKKAKSATLAVG